MSKEDLNLQHEAEHAKPGSKRSVFVYLAILFIAAIFLLLLAYLMQQRTNAQKIDDLKQSFTSMMSVQELLEENSRLREEISGLEDRLDQAEQELNETAADRDAFQAKWQSADESAENSRLALYSFWALDRAYVEQDLTRCQELITLLETCEDAGGPILRYVTDAPDMAERYQEIVEDVGLPPYPQT